MRERVERSRVALVRDPRHSARIGENRALGRTIAVCATAPSMRTDELLDHVEPLRRLGHDLADLIV